MCVRAFLARARVCTEKYYLILLHDFFLMYHLSFVLIQYQQWNSVMLNNTERRTLDALCENHRLIVDSSTDCESRVSDLNVRQYTTTTRACKTLTFTRKEVTSCVSLSRRRHCRGCCIARCVSLVSRSAIMHFLPSIASLCDACHTSQVQRVPRAEAFSVQTMLFSLYI